MDYLRLPFRPAFPVIQENHVVPCAGAVADGHADVRVLPLLDHEPAAQPAAKGVRLFPADPHDAGDGHMILRPTGGLFRGETGVHRNAAVVPLHQPDIGSGQLVAQLLLHAGNQFVAGSLLGIFLFRIAAVLPEIREIKVLEIVCHR